MRRPIAFLTPPAVALATLAVPDPAAAHGLVGREDLPLPPWLFAWAASIVLIVSFAGLAVLWTKPKLEGASSGRVLGVPLAFELLAGACGVALFAVVVYAGFAGSQVDTANLAPTTIFVLFWVLVPLSSVALGDLFRYVSPWRAVARATGWAARKLGGDSLPAPLAYPERLGRWPAVAGILCFGWLELISPDRGDPSFLATLALVYAAVQLIGSSLYGEQAWTANADAFGGFFALCGRLSPLDWRDRELHVRKPLSGATTMAAVPGAVALLCVLIGVTSYDGLSQSSLWLDLLPDLQRAFEALGLSSSASLQAAGLLGLATVCGLVAGLYRLGADGVRTAAGEVTTGEAARTFAHALIPIAAAYLAAHYVSLLVFQGQALWYLASDPLGRGDDIFGTAGRAIDYSWLGSTAIWYVQVTALVVGHVAGLVLAHDRAIFRFSDAKVAARSQYWMLAVMVSFTSIGLWLLSAGR
ncbi:MAG: fenitrothion hydrolase [Baekduia sp.]